MIKLIRGRPPNNIPSKTFYIYKDESNKLILHSKCNISNINPSLIYNIFYDWRLKGE
jgi:hypothetical protein